MNRNRLFSILAVLGLLATTLASGAGRSYAADDSRTFPETGKTVNDPFLSYWNNHGGLAQQGYPITDANNEKNDADGKTYLTQYFERARFEYHPENAGTQYEVLLGLLGKEALAAKYGNKPPAQPTQIVPGGDSRTFSETGKTVTGLFLSYWNTHGGLEQQGFPITEAYNEKNDADGKTYITQYFERARFEYHPESTDPQYKVLLGLVGKEINSRKQGTGGTGGTGGTPPSTPAGLNAPGWTHITVTANKIAIFYNATTGVAYTARLETNAPLVGSLTLLQKYPDASKGHDELGKGWTDVEAAPNNQVLLYKPSGGDFMFLKVADDGQVSQALHYTGVGPFSKVTIDPVSGIIFYQNKDTNTTAVNGITPEGFPYNLKDEGPATGGIADDLMVPIVVGGLWYDYAPDSGQVNVYMINAKGELVGAVPPTNVGKGVTQIVSDYNSHAVFYSKSDGVFKTAKVIGPNGQFAQVQITNGTRSEKSWSIVAGTQSVFLICYDDKGNIQTNYVAPENGAVVPLKSYDAAK
ncbi:MAG: hypothetical protein ABI670_21645 [Chloroflexota bacterium]